MDSTRIIALVNAAATGTASPEQLEELSRYSRRELLIARRRVATDTRHRATLIPSSHLVRVLHAFIHAFLSRSTASHAPATHSTP